MPGTVSEPQDASGDQEMADVVDAAAAAAASATADTNGSAYVAHAEEENGHGDGDTAMPMNTGGTDSEQIPAGGNDGDGGDGFDEDGSQRMRMLPGSTDTAASFQFDREDHTLGNALRYVIMKNPVVEFCGYTIPHPSEDKMNLRIQTWDDASVYDVLEKGLDDLMNLCDVVTEKFTIARDEFRAR